MKLEPSTIVLYVADLKLSSNFYQDLLGIKVLEVSSTFHAFEFSKGMNLGLKAKHSVEPPVNTEGSGELAFSLEKKEEIDELYEELQNKNIAFIQTPTLEPYGYTMVAKDPDGNRLRAVFLNRSM